GGGSGGRSQKKKNRDVSARPKTSSSRAPFLSYPSVRPQPACAGCVNFLRLRAAPAPDTETPPGGGGGPAARLYVTEGPSGLIQRRSIGTLATGAQVGNAGVCRNDQRSHKSFVHHKFRSQSRFAACLQSCPCALRFISRYRPEHGHDSSSRRLPRR